jgi:hypothetical protein
MMLNKTNASLSPALKTGSSGAVSNSNPPEPANLPQFGQERQVEIIPASQLTPYKGNARTHSKRQIRQIADSIGRFGFVNPILIDDAGQIISGHGRVEAAKLLGIAAVPVLRLSHLSDAEKRAYVLADNRIAQQAGWDREILVIELQGLIDLDFEVELTGFSTADIDIVLDAAAEAQDGPPAPEDEVPDTPAAAATVSRPGDLWALGAHRLLCGNALDPAAYQTLMGGELAEMVFTDPPYNVPIDGHVSGHGRVRHRAFVTATSPWRPGRCPKTSSPHSCGRSSSGLPGSARMAPFILCAWIGATWARCLRPGAPSTPNSRTWWSGTRPMPAWARSTGASMS